MVRTTVTLGWIAMARQNDFCLQFRGAGHRPFEVVDFKPQQDAVPRREFRIADATMMMLHIPVVQLKHQPAIRNEALIMGATMVALTTEEPLIPAAARLNIPH